MKMLNIQKHAQDEMTVVTLEGRLDTLSSPDFEEVLTPLANEPGDIVLDCTDLDYISSSGLRVLLKARKIQGSSASLKLIHVNEQVREIFEVTGFGSILTIE